MQLLIAGSSFGLCLSAEAHHSRAGFDVDSITAFQGRVTNFNWSNPHVYIEVEAVDDSGAEATWVIETDAIPILLRSGWTPQSVSVGDPVLVRANPGKEGNEQHGLLVSLAKDDGTILLPRAHFERDLAPARATARAESLAGVWELPFGETGDFMTRWATHPLTPAGLAGFESFTPADRPSGKCIPNPTPQFMAMPFLNEIELLDDRVIMRSEFLDAERVIYLDGREHPADGPRTNQGHSIGRWEDDVLVVDTTLFADHRAPIRAVRGSSRPDSRAQGRCSVGRTAACRGALAPERRRHGCGYRVYRRGPRVPGRAFHRYARVALRAGLRAFELHVHAAVGPCGCGLPSKQTGITTDAR
jgi:hypothetical protein